MSLYTSTNKLLNKYFKDKFKNDEKTYEELGNDILSLIYYFKISVIGKKWIDNNKVEEIKIQNKDKKQDKNKDKKQDKKKEKNKEKDKNKEKENIYNFENDLKNKEIIALNETINKIIFVLENLYKAIKNK